MPTSCAGPRRGLDRRSRSATAATTAGVIAGFKAKADVASAAGFNAYPMRTSTAPAMDVAVGATVSRRHGGTYELLDDPGAPPDRRDRHVRAVAQRLHDPRAMEAFDPGRTPRAPTTSSPSTACHLPPHMRLAVRPRRSTTAHHQWSMTIDLVDSATAATRASWPASRRTTFRSSARSRSLRGREMHWMRVDFYFQGDAQEADDGRRRRPAGQLPAVRECAVRAGLPGGCHRSLRRGD